jgi:hypothetical protein
MRGHVVQSECGQARELFPSRDLWSRCVDVAQCESREMLHRRSAPRHALAHAQCIVAKPQAKGVATSCASLCDSRGQRQWAGQLGRPDV